VPHGADGMDHPLGWQPIAAGDLGIARGAAAERLAFGEEIGTGGAVNGAVDATAAKQG